MTFDLLPDQQALADAASIVYQHVNPTPLINWPLLSAHCGTNVFVKHENHLPTGAFKVRGGLTYLHKLRQTNPDCKGVIGATRGNHGQSMGFAAQALGLKATIVIPEGNNPQKNAAMEAMGGELITHGKDFQESLEYAHNLSEREGLHFMPSFAPDLLSGVGTYGMEIFTTAPAVDAIIVPIGMGSGICSTIAAKIASRNNAEIYGVVAEAAPAYALSFKKGGIVTTQTADTYADGLACRSPMQSALDIIRQGAKDIFTVSDDEIKSAIRLFAETTHNMAEGAAAAPLAALIRHKEHFKDKTVAIVLSGGNIDTADLPHLFA